MSDETGGTDASTGMPIEAAPEAPADTGVAAQTARPTAPEPEPAVRNAQKPRTPDDDYDELLKKSALKYRAGGKEKSITSAADLRRLLSSRDTTETAVAEAHRAKVEADGITAKLSAMEKMQPRERARAIAELLGGGEKGTRLVREAIEEEILAEDAARKAQEHLTPREREYEARLSARERELTDLREQQESAQRAQEETAYVERVNQAGDRLTKAAVGALKKANISGEYAPHFLPSIANRMDRNERLGLGLDEDELAEMAVREHESMADSYYGSLDVPALADKLGGMAVTDPEDATKQTTRLKLLMRECARRLRSSMGAGLPSPLPARLQQQQGGDRELTRAEKLDASRTFGGGAR